tara:strand:- start:20915 stop:22060 length:1146 start_codon:yes stop_codon:yes gene_type:complete
MKITIKRTEDQLALIRAMGSNNREEAYEAQAAVADLLGPVISEVINNAPTVGNLFTTLTYDWDDNPSLPLDLFHDITDEDYIQVYSQQVAGGLPYSQVFPAHNELKFQTYTLDSALAFDRKYVRKARLDVVSKTFTRMAQEILLKQDRTAFNVLATALIKATTISAAGGSAAAGNHITTASATDRFVLADFNKLITLSKRINSSFVGGTPVGGSKAGITDIMCSPEMVEQLRGMAYNPINTANSPSGTTGGDGFVAPDSLREQLYSAAGLPAFYGINIMEQLELGKSQRFNKIFASINAAEGSPVSSFASDDDEILIGVDRSKDALIRPVVLDEGNTGDLSVLVDDQFSVRQNKIGYYGKVEEGRVCIDDRALVGLHVELS